MTFRAPVRKPYGPAPSPRMASGAARGLWRDLAIISPFMVGGAARGLWNGLAFIAPFVSKKAAGNSTLLNAHGKPIGSMTSGSTLQWRGTPYGLGVGISGASNLLQQDNIEFIETSDGVGTGDLTMIVLANPIAEARVSWGLAQGNLANNTNVWMGFNNAVGSLVTATSGLFSFAARFENNPTGIAGAGVAGAIDGKYHLFGGSRRGTTYSAFVDGVLRNSATATAYDIASGALGFAIGQRPEATTLRIDTSTNIVYVAAWNRALSNLEMYLLARDPFAMFRQRNMTKTYYVPASGGADVRKEVIQAYMRAA